MLTDQARRHIAEGVAMGLGHMELQLIDADGGQVGASRIVDPKLWTYGVTETEAVFNYPVVEWVFTGRQPAVHSWRLTQGGEILFADKFEEPSRIRQANDKIRIRPRFRIKFTCEEA